MSLILQETGDALLLENGDHFVVDETDPGVGVGTGAGDSTAIAVALAIWPSVGSGDGTSTAIAIGQDGTSVASGVGSGAGDSTAIAVGRVVWSGVGSGEGTSSANAYGGANEPTLPDALTATLDPEVLDDGSGGPLNFLWTQVSGPAHATIATPGNRTTEVGLPRDVTGAYVFHLLVRRANDDLFGTALWRVYGIGELPVDNPNAIVQGSRPTFAGGAITLTANGVEKTGLIESVRIAEQLNGSDTCTMSIYGGRVDDPAAASASFEVFSDVVLTRHNDETGLDVRMFAGICLSMQRTVSERHLFFEPSLVGYAWHFSRVKVTKTYAQMSISAIAADLLSMAPGGITAGYIAESLPIATVAFDDVTIAEALTELMRFEHDLHWRVDYFKRLHVASTEIGDDPVGLTVDHPSLADLTITSDGSQVVNRVSVSYDSLITKPAIVDGEIEVGSLEGYSPLGGVTTINGNTVHYTGTMSRTKHPVGNNNVVVHFTAIPVEAGGPFVEGYQPTYWLTFVTAEGETPAVATGAGFVAIDGTTNAYDIRLTQLTSVDPLALARVTAINIYREISSVGGSHVYQVGSLSIPGRSFVDTLADDDIPLPFKALPAFGSYETGVFVSGNTADQQTHFLVGCTGTQDMHTTKTITVDNETAQATLAAALEETGDDAGVIAITLNGGSISDKEAERVAKAYLAANVMLRDTVSCRVRDDLAHPGHILSVDFPPPIDCSTDLTIQQVAITGFTKRVPHSQQVTAAPYVITLDELLGRPPLPKTPASDVSPIISPFVDRRASGETGGTL